MARADARQRPGALLVTSHDRAFLDGVVERIWELRDRRLSVFRGNYSSYATQREERDARARKDEGTLAERIERERELVQRYRSHRKFPKMHEHEARLEALLELQEAAPRRRKTGVLALNGVVRTAAPRSGEVAVARRGAREWLSRQARRHVPSGSRRGAVRASASSDPTERARRRCCAPSRASLRRSMAGSSWATACRSATSRRSGGRRCRARPCSRR